MVRVHTHDVQALVICRPPVESMSGGQRVGKARKGHVLVSGGVDTSLSLYSVPGFKTLVSDSLSRRVVGRADACTFDYTTLSMHRSPLSSLYLVMLTR